jgi:hypothetical protein
MHSHGFGSIQQFPAEVTMDNYFPVVSEYSGRLSGFLVNDLSQVAVKQPLYTFDVDGETAHMVIESQESGVFYRANELGEYVHPGQTVGYILPDKGHYTYYFQIDIDADIALEVGSYVQITNGDETLQGTIQTLFVTQVSHKKTKLGIVIKDLTTYSIFKPNAYLMIELDDRRRLSGRRQAVKSFKLTEYKTQVN